MPAKKIDIDDIRTLLDRGMRTDAIARCVGVQETSITRALWKEGDKLLHARWLRAKWEVTLERREEVYARKRTRTTFSYHRAT